MTKTEHIIAMMIEKTFEIIDSSSLELFDKLTIEQINKEFRTIRLQLPRQTGQTSSAISVAKQYFKKPLYVCNAGMKNLVKKDISALTYEQIKNHNNLVGKSFDCVIIDNASLIETKEILENTDLGTMSLKDNHFLYILVG
jgi:hypothetical protein